MESFATLAASRSPELLHLAHLLTGDERAARELVARELARLERRWRRTDPFAADARLRRGVFESCLRRSRRGALVGALRAAAAWIVPRLAVAPPAQSRSAPPPGEDPPDERELAWGALARLTPRQRVVLVAHHADEVDPAELADVLGTRPAAVRRELDRAHATVRSALPSTLLPSTRLQSNLPVPAGDPGAVVRRVLADPRRHLAPGPDLAGEIRLAGRAWRAERRRRVLVAVAGAAAVVTVVAVPSLLVVREDSRQAATLRAPAASTGLLPWVPRGGLSNDARLQHAATEVWQRANPHSPRRTFLVWAGRIGDGRVVVLQGRDAKDRPRVAQVEDRGHPAELVLSAEGQVPRLGSPALVVTYAGNLDPALGLSPGSGSSLLQLLVAPEWVTAEGDPERLDVRLRSPYAQPARAAQVWRWLAVRADGLSRTWLQPERQDSPWETLVRLAEVGAGTRRLATIGVRAGRLVPVDPLIEQRPDAQAGGLAEPDVLDDVIAARDVLDALPLNPGADRTSQVAWLTPTVVRALAEVPEHPAGEVEGVRVSLLDVVPPGGGHVLLFVVRSGDQLLCVRATPSAADPAAAPLTADACVVPRDGYSVLTGVARSSDPGANVEVGGSGAIASGSLIAVPITVMAASAPSLTWTAHRPTGEIVGRVSTTMLRATAIHQRQ